jgi:hypothetical protein
MVKKAVKAKKPEPKKEEGAKTYHIAKRASDGKWQVKFASGEIAIKLFDTQAEAIDYAKEHGRQSKRQHPRSFPQGEDAQSLSFFLDKNGRPRIIRKPSFAASVVQW